MQPNSPLQPLQPMQPKVPGVPQVPGIPDAPKVPDVPQIPQTPMNELKPIETPKPTEMPKITGVSMPAGSNKKPESPEQRNNKINAANAPKPQIEQKKQNLLHKPVTMEEVEEYRRKSAKKRRTILVSILIVLAVGGITTAVVLLKIKQQNYQDLSSIYNDNIPFVIRNTDDKAILVSLSGKKLTEKYDNIDNFESDRSLAYYTEEDENITAIIDNSGKEKFSTKNTLVKINEGENYLLTEEDKTYVLNKDGKKISEKPLVSIKYDAEQKYFLVADETGYAVINKAGEQKISDIINKNTVKFFSYGENEYDGNSYCAFVNTRKKDSKLYIYNCETSQEITNFEDVYYTGNFENSHSALLTSEKGSSYFYDNKMIYNSETKDQEIMGGIIKKADEERYFNPITRKSTESFPGDSLIKQDNLSSKTSIDENCSIYKNHAASNLMQICNNIYYNNKLLSLNYSRSNYYLPNEKLDNFLAYHNKHYIFKQNQNNQNVAVIDAESGKEIYSEVSIQINSDTPDYATSRFVIKNSNGIKTVIDLATDKTAEYEDGSTVRIENNYYIVTESTDSGYVARYYNADHKEIYKEEK